MKKVWNGIFAAMILSSSLLTGCAGVGGGGRGSGDYSLSQNEGEGEGSISRYQTVAHSPKNAIRSQSASRGSS